MALSLENLTRLNPWWDDPSGWEACDPHLIEIANGIILPQPPFVSEIAIGDRAAHVVRGPRQVGKSTGLKMMIVRALAAGLPPTRVIYLSLDLLDGQPVAEFAATVRRAKELARPDGPVLLLLDEVTVISNWARAVKDLWDGGDIRGDTVVCTGSSAIDLGDGEVESLPGRRGSGYDYLVLPQPFASFAQALDPLIPSSPSLRIADLFGKDGREAILDAQRSIPRLRPALRSYLSFGGLPAGVIEAASGAAAPSQATQRVLWDSISREVRRRGASENALRALLERVVLALSSKTNWTTLAREMDIPLGNKSSKIPPDHKTVKEYIEFLGRCYVLMVTHFWKANLETSDQAKDKKIYLDDPLLHSIILEKTPSLRFDEAAAVENAVALALYRKYEADKSQAEGSANPEAIHAWETKSPREIDFVCGPRSQAELAEVKYQRGAGSGDTLVMRNAFPGRPAVLVTLDKLDFADEYALVPAELFLWALAT